MNTYYFTNLLLPQPFSQDAPLLPFPSPFQISARDPDFRVKYKTEICRNWEMGTCEFGSNCAFAHGYEELRNRPHKGSNYKTKKCKQFHDVGFCIYGNRCQFKHRNPSVDTAPSSPRPTEEPSKTQSGDSSRRRLRIFIELEQRANNNN